MLTDQRTKLCFGRGHSQGYNQEYNFRLPVINDWGQRRISAIARPIQILGTITENTPVALRTRRGRQQKEPNRKHDGEGDLFRFTTQERDTDNELIRQLKTKIKALAEGDSPDGQNHKLKKLIAEIDRLRHSLPSGYGRNLDILRQKIFSQGSPVWLWVVAAEVSSSSYW